MSATNRRQFLRDSARGLIALAAGPCWKADLWANPLGLPVGLELYTVRNELAKDMEATLKQVAAIGYKQVEFFDFYKRKASEIRRILNSNGLTAPSAHYRVQQIK